MLDTLELVDWNPYKWQQDFPDMPSLILGLTSPDQKTRLASYDGLHKITEASFKKTDDLIFLIIPFLVEILSMRLVEEKDLQRQSSRLSY